MKERPISVTEAARNFADCINRVRYQGLSFVLEKNGKPVARLVPAETDKEARGSADSSQAESKKIVLEQTASGPQTERPANSEEEIRRQFLQW